MIILDLSNYYNLPLTIKPLFMQIANIEIVQKMKYENLGFKQILEQYTLDEIKFALNQSKVKNGYLFVESNTKADRIVRLLEYGGEGIKPSHLITDIRNRFSMTFRKEVYANV